jgi:hypothetical protein
MRHMTAPQVERPQVPRVADERAMLEAWLDYHRATLLMKCAGLSDEQLKLRSAEPSTLSLLGLVRHLTDVERGWFRRGVGGQKGPEVEPIYYSDERPEGDIEDRWIYLHMIEEYARHNGHADLLRERIDGATGD